MKLRLHRWASDELPGFLASAESARSRSTVGTRHPVLRWITIVLLVLALIAVIGRAMLPSLVRDYVNRTLDRNPLYAGRIGEVEIHLWRGAYSIRDVSISKVTGNVPVPFFAAPRVDFAVQWDALLHGEIVGRVLMDEPE